MVELSFVSGAGQPAPYAIVPLGEPLRARMVGPVLRVQVQFELERLVDEVNDPLPDHERLALVIAAEPSSIENGFLTPTMKLRRSRTEAAVQPQVDRWFADARKVQWADGDIGRVEAPMVDAMLEDPAARG